MTSIQPAHIDWSDPGAPAAPQFDDYYFSSDDGAAESRYIFLDHNDLPGRFERHGRRTFVVAETGFGTGLNLMVLWERFNAYRLANPDAPCQRLHFVSFEKHPLSATDLSRAHRSWPQFEAMARQVRDAYPMATPGCHRLVLDHGAVTLDLWFGDVQAQLPSLDRGPDGLVDAWFLDGFTPSRNPAMWQPPLYEQMARLSRPEATFATFTAAGFVRRALAEAGFGVHKAPGFGPKREMAFGQLQGDAKAPRQPDTVTIVGAGLAAATTALALVRRGVRVELFSQADGPADGASGNRQGALYPLLNRADDGLSRFYQQAFPLARQHLLQMVSAGHAIEHELCGVLQLPVDDKGAEKLKRLTKAGFPTELAHGVDAGQASTIADLPLSRGGLYYPLGGWLCPTQLTRATLAEAHKSGLLRCHYGRQLTAMASDGGQWQLQFGEQAHPATTLVLALGHQSRDFAATAPLPLNPVRGQIAYPEAGPVTQSLKTVLCADGYLVPALAGRLTCGASFGRGDADTDWRDSDKAEIGRRMANSFGAQPWAEELQGDALGGAEHGRAAVRAAVRDHLPLVGPVPDWDALSQTGKDDPVPYQAGLYLITGLGSRGLTSAALCAELLASQLCDEPRPVSDALQAQLAPGRFWLRRRAKGHPLPPE